MKWYMLKRLKAGMINVSVSDDGAVEEQAQMSRSNIFQVRR